jgi:hypothetical protein
MAAAATPAACAAVATPAACGCRLRCTRGCCVMPPPQQQLMAGGRRRRPLLRLRPLLELRLRPLLELRLRPLLERRLRPLLRRRLWPLLRRRHRCSCHAICHLPPWSQQGFHHSLGWLPALVGLAEAGRGPLVRLAEADRDPLVRLAEADRDPLVRLAEADRSPLVGLAGADGGPLWLTQATGASSRAPQRLLRLPSLKQAAPLASPVPSQLQLRPAVRLSAVVRLRCSLPPSAALPLLQP